jgi:hypothetical protein
VPSDSDIHHYTYVSVETTDNKRVGEISGEKLVSSETVNLDSKENADRFAKALKRAVLLCGGKVSTF